MPKEETFKSIIEGVQRRLFVREAIREIEEAKKENKAPISLLDAHQIWELASSKVEGHLVDARVEGDIIKVFFINEKGEGEFAELRS